ncbi:MAG: hypothetical protein Q8K94_09625, partial [Moraxellaceae bacterium]|nr:hypothetical protein [Moraxellaceae bacterium]
MWRLFGLLTLLAMPQLSWAVEAGLPMLSTSRNASGGEDYTVSLQLLGIMTILTLIPALVLGMTAFTRIIIVLAILRQALGTGQSPSNQVLLTISLFLTFFVMSPVLDVAYK